MLLICKYSVILPLMQLPITFQVRISLAKVDTDLFTRYYLAIHPLFNALCGYWFWNTESKYYLTQKKKKKPVHQCQIMETREIRISWWGITLFYLHRIRRFQVFYLLIKILQPKSALLFACLTLYKRHAWHFIEFPFKISCNIAKSLVAQLVGIS